MGKNIAIIALSIALLSLGAYTFSARGESGAYKSYIENGSEATFLSFRDAADNMSEELKIVTVSGDDTFIATKLGSITKSAAQAQRTLTSLPVNHNIALNATDFLSLCEDYTYTLMIKLINGGSLSEEEKEALSALSENCAALGEDLGTFSDSRTDDFAWYDKDYEFITDETDGTYSKMFSGFEKLYENFDGIKYNGKYSSGTTQEGSAQTEGDQSEGGGSKEDNVYDYTQIESALNEKYADSKNVNVSYNNQGENKGGAGNYHSFSVDDGESLMNLNYSRQSGNLINARSNRSVSETLISEEEAKKSAEEFLSEAGLSGMKYQSAQTNGNVMLLNYAFCDDCASYLADTATVGVALDNAEVLSYDAGKYYESHKERSFGEAALTGDEAAKNLSSGLSVASVRTVALPMNDKSECLAYEFTVNAKDESFLVVIDANTGRELDIKAVKGQ